MTQPPESTLPPDGYLAFPDDLAVWLKVPASDLGLLAALKAASRRFAGAVRHPVRRIADDTTTLYGDCTTRLLLPAAPVVSVDQVLLDDVAITDWKVRKDIGVLRRDQGWPDWAEVTLTWTHGWDPIPEDIQEAVIDQARTIWRVVPGVQTVQAGGESITYGVQAAVGVTAQWTAAVEAHQLNRGDHA